MSVSLSTTAVGSVVMAPVRFLDAAPSRYVIDGVAPVAADEPRVRVTVKAVDQGDGSLAVYREGSDGANYRWIHHTLLTLPEAPTTTDVPTYVGEAVREAVEAPLRAQHAATIAALNTAHERALRFVRDGARADVLTEMGEALAKMVDDGDIDEDDAQSVAGRLGVEMPAREFEITVTVTTTRTLRVKGTSPSATEHLAAEDEEWLRDTFSAGDVEIVADDDVEIIDDGVAYGDVDISIDRVERV